MKVIKKLLVGHLVVITVVLTFFTPLHSSGGKEYYSHDR